MANEQLNLDLRVNSAQLTQGLTEAIAGLKKLQQSLKDIDPAAKSASNATDQAKVSIATTGQAATAASNPLGQMATILRGVAAVATTTGSGMKVLGQNAYNAGAGVQASGSMMQRALQGTLGIANTIAYRIGLIGTSTSVASTGFAKLRDLAGGALAKIVPQSTAGSAAISGIGTALQRVAGVGAGVGGILAGFGGSMFARFGQGINGMASKFGQMGQKGQASFSGIGSKVQQVSNLLTTVVSKANQFASTAGRWATAMSGLGGLAGAAKNLMSMAKNVGVMFVQAKAMQAMTGAMDHLASGIIDFNSKLQTANVAFNTLITNEIRRSVVAANDLGTAINGSLATGKLDKYGNQVKGINQVWDETLSIYNDKGIFGPLEAAGKNHKLTVEQLITSYNDLTKTQEGSEAKLTELAKTNPAFFAQVVEGTESAKTAAEDYVTLLKNYANVTPFRFPEILEMSKKMRAYGFAAEETVPAINAIGEAVAAMGGNEDQMQRIGYALGQMRNSGRVYQRQMMQLANAGINGYEILGEGLFKKLQAGSADAIQLSKEAAKRGFDVTKGFSVEAVRELTRAGLIGGKGAADALLAGMQDRFAGSQDKLGNTFAGAMSTIADVTQTMSADIFKGLFDFVGNEDPTKGPLGLVQTFKDVLLSPELQQGVQSFSATIKEFFASFNDEGEGGMSGPQKLIAGITMAFGILGNIISTFVVPWLNYVSANIAFLFNVIKGIRSQIEEFIGTIAIIFNGVGEGADHVMGLFEMIDQMRQVALAPMIEFFGNLMSGITMIFQGLFVTLQGIFPTILSLFGTVMQIFAALSGVFQFIGGLIGLFSGVIGVLFNILGGILDGLLQAFLPIIQFLGDLFGKFGELFNIIQQYIMPIFMFLGSVIGGVFGVIGRIIGGLIGGPLGLLGKVLGGIIDGIGGMIKNVGGMFAGIVNFIIDAINLLIRAYNILPFGDIAEVKHIKVGIFETASAGASKILGPKAPEPAKSQTLNDVFTFPPIVPGDMLGRGPVKSGSGGGGGSGKNKWDDFDAKLKAWIDKVKSETKAMYQVEIDAIEDLKKEEKKRFEDSKEAAKRAHEARMRQFDDEKTAQDRFFDSALEGINDQKDALNAASDARKGEDDRAKLERDLAFAIAQQASGTLDPLEAARNVAEARAALDDFNLSAQEKAALDALDAQAEAIDDQKTLWERDYADRKEAEARSYADAQQALEDQHTATMDLMTAQQEALKTQMEADLLAFENHVMDMATLLKQGKMTGADFAKETLKEFETLGNNYAEIGETLGKNLAYGLQKSKKLLDSSAKELAAIIAKYLKTHSPTEAGPLAEDQSIWGKNIAQNMMKGMKDTFTGDFAMKIGLGNFVDQLTGIKPMKLGLEGTMGNVTVMNFNFAPGSIRDDKDIYALAEAVEKRMTRTLRQR